ncbi:SDR family NAD(P)-dependent oxidoreductase [Hirschia baltica]|uniref:Short-chain dehydrogenase/reductase SDR n=1 Tax=Hirschia baltica (strain ATCC 49814 / DSM 5838 / IFAM 1418) TaxID=582402 RepID=C6XQD2_HIRBI|nr:SDR family NAD(P)-dependent oxidoreductase [Hirschia baltica]ACT60431.1 short-chain dehydrogenase/reductase SDR [Hirschia baltica ATCC 49814]
MTYNDRFAGRTAIITGGASGLGLACAQRIIAEGGRVTIWDMDEVGLQKAKQAHPSIHTRLINITNPDEIESAVKEAFDAMGRIDILINSAGITGETAPIQDFSIESWRKVMSINLDGVFFTCRAVIPFMLKNAYGRIINIASVAGKEGNPNASAYSASKAGVIGFTKSLGKELAQSGIIANSLTPATFESPILDQLPQSQVDYMRSKIPMGRLGIAEESASMVCFAVSEECSFTTAATFDTSGGRTTY